MSPRTRIEDVLRFLGVDDPDLLPQLRSEGLFERDELEPYEAVTRAGLSRLRPVVLAAGTTVLGVVPLLQDVFWIGLAVTIMAGLAFGTVLTMVLVPTLYATLFRIPSPAR